MWTITTEGASNARLLKFNGTPVAKFYADRLTLDTQAHIARILTAFALEAPELDKVR
jgi:hypothetical protein